MYMKLLFIQLALGLFQTDMAVKHEIENHDEFDEGRELLGGRILIKKLHNHGMAGGRFAGHMPALIRVSGALSAAAAASFLRLLWKQERMLEKTGYALLLGGALSNLYDRCKKGYVVDYISFRTPWERLNRLVFNLSDFFIIVGTFLICIGQAGRSDEN